MCMDFAVAMGMRSCCYSAWCVVAEGLLAPSSVAKMMDNVGARGIITASCGRERLHKPTKNIVTIDLS